MSVEARFHLKMAILLIEESTQLPLVWMAGFLHPIILALALRQYHCVAL